MTLQKLPHDLIKELLDSMPFTVEFTDVTDLTGGVLRLNGICNFHYSQIGRDITIGGNKYKIKDYDYSAKTLTVTGTDSISATSFDLYRPIFVHGEPIKEEGELNQIDRIDLKTPLVYLLEPYPTEEDDTFDSAIGYRSDITLCFLTEADTGQWSTDEHYRRAINPMRILMKELKEKIINSPLFYTTEQKSKPRYYANFSLRVKDVNSNKSLFKEKLSGCSEDIRLEVYKVFECEC